MGLNTNSTSQSRFTFKTKNGSKFDRQSSQQSVSSKKGSLSPGIKFKRDFKKPPTKFINPYFIN